MYFPLLFNDPTFLLLIPAFILTIYAQNKVQRTFAKFSRVPARSGYSGAQVARALLDNNGLHDVPVEMIQGRLSDHYDPRKRAMRLSPEVYNGRSLAAIGVAAHETGHAIQHSLGYMPLFVRNSIFPIASFGSQLAFPLFFIGFLFTTPFLMDLGIVLFSAAVLFQAVTLPVEFNASSRALAMLETQGMLSRGEELDGAGKVLRAAALTYVAAMAVALLQLVRLLLLRGDRDR